MSDKFFFYSGSADEQNIFYFRRGTIYSIFASFIYNIHIYIIKLKL